MIETATRYIALETPRLLLRPLTVEDASAITMLANNWNVVQHLSLLPYPYEHHHAREFIAHIHTRPVTTAFALGLRTGHQDLIGLMGFTFPENGIAEGFGYWLGEPYWGHGYATEAACAVITYGFEQRDASEFRAGCRPCNPASRNVLEKCRFRQTGHGTMPSKALGADTPIDLYSLHREAWSKRPGTELPVTIVIGDGCTGTRSV